MSWYISKFKNEFRIMKLRKVYKKYVVPFGENNIGKKMKKMVHTKESQIQARIALDMKLEASLPRREILESLAVECASNPSPDNTFQYAFCLSKSSQDSELKYAIKILDSLVKEGYDYQLDCMYGAATALYLLREYKEARIRCENILRSYPEHTLAIELHLASIEASEAEDERRVKQIATVSSTALAVVGVAAGVAGMMLKKR